ncbi:nuclear transport factor 2 family protein [Foetidibacter luteolus]|uniref:nuclear transport factor 2 family protein n=1 Tax=Foetidibacter luteolus TaxID=2608880 RepID=UPI00129BA69C|nr:nuclear transport factor 2 family protein [Foetidibacter luteolus]
MTTNEIAAKLAEYCRTGQYEKAQKELYANDVVSIEPFATPAFEKETSGLEAIIAKGHKFESMVEESYSNEVSEPLVSENSIAFKLTMDIKMKGRDRETWQEICVYQVKDGKVVSEQFFM